MTSNDTTSLRIERVDLLAVSMQLREPFVTSFGPQQQRDVVLVRAHAQGVEGWGELVAGREPVYSEETVASATTMDLRSSGRTAGSGPGRPVDA